MQPNCLDNFFDFSGVWVKAGKVCDCVSDRKPAKVTSGLLNYSNSSPERTAGSLWILTENFYFSRCSGSKALQYLYRCCLSSPVWTEKNEGLSP